MQISLFIRNALLRSYFLQIVQLMRGVATLSPPPLSPLEIFVAYFVAAFARGGEGAEARNVKVA